MNQEDSGPGRLTDTHLLTIAPPMVTIGITTCQVTGQGSYGGKCLSYASTA
jgi:hypothetical protein